MTKEMNSITVGSLIAYSSTCDDVKMSTDISALGVVCKSAKKLYVSEIYPQKGVHVDLQKNSILLCKKFASDIILEDCVADVLLHIAFRIFCLKVTLADIGERISQEIKMWV